MRKIQEVGHPSPQVAHLRHKPHPPPGSYSKCQRRQTGMYRKSTSKKWLHGKLQHTLREPYAFLVLPSTAGSCGDPHPQLRPSNSRIYSRCGCAIQLHRELCEHPNPPLFHIYTLFTDGEMQLKAMNQQNLCGPFVLPTGVR